MTVLAAHNRVRPLTMSQMSSLLPPGCTRRQAFVGRIQSLTGFALNLLAPHRWLNRTLVCLLVLTAASAVSTNPSHAQSLTDESLRSASYLFPTSSGWWVSLQDGEFVETDEYGGTIRLWLENTAYGDLDGDGVNEAVVVLVWNGGGSGTFLSLGVVRSWNGFPMHTATIRLPERAEVLSLEVSDRQIVARLLEPRRPTPRSFTDPEQTHRYELTDGDLVEVWMQYSSEDGR